MKNLFITHLKAPVDAWRKAFPDLVWSKELRIEALSELTTVWIHIQLEHGDSWKSAVQEVLSCTPNAKIIVVSNNPERSEALAALALGVVGYLHAYAHHKILKEVANIVTHGGVWLGQDLLKYLISASVRTDQYQHDQREVILEGLTKREREVAIEASKGLSNKEIARILTISERTVKAHLTSVFDTLKVKDRLHLALVLQGQANTTHLAMQENIRSSVIGKLQLN